MRTQDTDKTSKDAEAIALALRSAREANTPMAGFPGEIPQTVIEAYVIQNASIAEWPDDVVAWKVGGVPPAYQEAYGAKRLAGPIFSKTVVKAKDGERVNMPAYHKGFVAVEAEYVLKLGDTSGLNTDTATADDIAAVIDTAYMGVEIASSPMLMINDLGPGVIISDFGNNFGLIIGPEVKDWTPQMLWSTSVSVDIDGARIGTASAAPELAGPFGAVLFLIEHLRGLGTANAEGIMVSTGAITGVHDTHIGAHSIVDFNGIGRIEIDITEI